MCNNNYFTKYLYQATGSEEGSVIFWDVVKGKIINCFNIEEN